MGDLKLIPVITMTIGPFEDWSEVRSPSRARRRRRKHRQNIRYFNKPDPKLTVIAGRVYTHPETLRALVKTIRDRANG